MHQKEKGRWLKHLDFMVLDGLTVTVVFWLICRIRMRMMGWDYTSVYRSTQIILLMLLLFVVAILPLHKNVLKRGIRHELKESCKFVSLLSVGIMLYHYLTKSGGQFSRSIFIIFWFAGSITVWLVRSVYKTFVKRFFLGTAALSNIVLLTSQERAEENYQNLAKYRENRFQICGVMIQKQDESFVTAPEKHDEEIFGIPGHMIIGDINDFDDFFIGHPVDEVYIDLNQQKQENMIAQDMIAQGITVHIALDKQFCGLPHQEIEQIGGRSVMTSAVQTVPAGQLMVKRAMDIVGALIGLVLTGIAFLIFAPIIYHQSKGPIFYAQTRVGLKGRRFRIYKFRSMYPDADKRKAELMKQNKMQGLMFKMDNDPRIFPIGRFMRKYSIDELPQFWNVLKGDMSLVGTRPPTVDEWTQYSPHHRARLSVKPGLTGMWQVSGRSNIVDFEKVVELDMKYIREWRLTLDCMLLLRTVSVVLQGSGAT